MRPRMHTRQSLLSRTATLGLGIALSHAGVGAPMVSLGGAFWEWDQGGYLQADTTNVAVFQELYPGNLPTNTVSASLGGAFFRSIATMQVTTSLTPTVASFNWTATLDAEASVAAGWPEGQAAAHSAVWLFFAGFELTGVSHLYTGATPIVEDATGLTHTSGSTLAPGFYSFLSNEQHYLAKTPQVTEGQTSHLVTEGAFDFVFEVIPAPGGAWLGALVAGVALGARRRRSA